MIFQKVKEESFIVRNPRLISRSTFPKSLTGLRGKDRIIDNMLLIAHCSVLIADFQNDVSRQWKFLHTAIQKQAHR